MPCEFPIKIKTSSGHNIRTKCKQCRSCRIAKHSSLKLRAKLEFQQCLSAEFISMTYRPDILPLNGTHSPFQAFCKRLRDHNSYRQNPNKIRYLSCGEFGDTSGNFHHHALLFNSVPLWDTNFTTQNGDQRLTKLWQLGRCHSGTVTPKSISYVTNYCTKSTLDCPDKKPFAHWSNHFGSNGMAALCQQLKKSNQLITSMPRFLNYKGETHALDRAMRLVIQKEFNLPETEDVDLEIKNYLQNLSDMNILPGDVTYNDHVTGKTIVIEEKHLPDYDLTDKTLAAIHKSYQENLFSDPLKQKHKI
ncbi:MAG: replication initiator protein [Microviridae sp.]|nr:MAG: replication initiator protein [Microviridae sp.]